MAKKEITSTEDRMQAIIQQRLSIGYGFVMPSYHEDKQICLKVFKMFFFKKGIFLKDKNPGGLVIKFLDLF